MNLIDNSNKPIFIQVKEWLENEILKDKFLSGQNVLSQNELAMLFCINPTTALKGISLLEAKGVLIKKRGIGMFVTENAKNIIYAARKQETLNNILDELVAEIRILDLKSEEVIDMIIKRLNEVD